MPPRLVPVIPEDGPTLPLQRPVLLVGRHPECDIRLELPSISRRHCCLALAYDRLILRDLSSRNGVRVNGLRVEEMQINNGDEVAIGPLIFRVVDLASAAATTALPSAPAAGNPPAPSTVPPGEDEIDLIPVSGFFPELA
jgi:pSer/pThr/pTyr-binding forkhead associated (FHA) protein